MDSQQSIFYNKYSFTDSCTRLPGIFCTLHNPQFKTLNKYLWNTMNSHDMTTFQLLTLYFFYVQANIVGHYGPIKLYHYVRPMEISQNGDNNLNRYLQERTHHNPIFLIHGFFPKILCVSIVDTMQ